MASTDRDDWNCCSDCGEPSMVLASVTGPSPLFEECDLCEECFLTYEQERMERASAEGEDDED